MDRGCEGWGIRHVVRHANDDEGIGMAGIVVARVEEKGGIGYHMRKRVAIIKITPIVKK